MNRWISALTALDTYPIQCAAFARNCGNNDLRAPLSALGGQAVVSRGLVKTGCLVRAIGVLLAQGPTPCSERRSLKFHKPPLKSVNPNV